MKTILLLFVSNITPLMCIVISGYMAINSIDGWGWFIFAAIDYWN